MPDSQWRLFALWGLLLAVIIIVGCTRDVTVAEIESDPESFYGDRVALEGVAQDGYSASGFGIYELRDATGAVWVVSRTGTPDDGTPLRVVGRVNSPIELGPLQLGTHVAEDERERM